MPSYAVLRLVEKLPCFQTVQSVLRTVSFQVRIRTFCFEVGNYFYWYTTPETESEIQA